MARGWESKSVEQQIEEARAQAPQAQETISPEEERRRREREDLLMSRARVVQQLDACRDPRYEKILRGALADLDARLGRVAGDGK